MEILPPLAGRMADGAQLIVGSLLEGGKILSCGSGASAALAQYFVTLMLNQFERDRPALPAVALNADSMLLTAVTGSFDFDELFSRQIRGLGQSQDLLLVVSGDDDQESINAAVQSAREQQMKVIALSSGRTGRLAELLGRNDVEIRVTQCTPSRTRELQLVILHSLCELIDQQLLGN